MASDQNLRVISHTANVYAHLFFARRVILAGVGTRKGEKSHAGTTFNVGSDRNVPFYPGVPLTLRFYATQTVKH